MYNIRITLFGASKLCIHVDSAFQELFYHFSKDIDPNHRQADFGDIIQTNVMIKHMFSPNLV